MLYQNCLCFVSCKQNPNFFIKSEMEGSPDGFGCLNLSLSQFWFNTKAIIVIILFLIISGCIYLFILLGQLGISLWNNCLAQLLCLVHKFLLMFIIIVNTIIIIKYSSHPLCCHHHQHPHHHQYSHRRHPHPQHHPPHQQHHH